MKLFLALLVTLCTPLLAEDLSDPVVVQAAQKTFRETSRPLGPVEKGQLIRSFGPSTNSTGELVLFRGQEWQSTYSHHENRVLAVAAGTVSLVGVDKEFGPFVEIIHTPQIKARYFFPGKAKVSPGHDLTRGYPIAVSSKPLFFQLFFRANNTQPWNFVDPAGFGIR